MTTTVGATNLDSLTRELSAFRTFQDLLDAPNYRPTILQRTLKHVRLADAYDRAQAARGDARRAYRGSSHAAPAVGDPVQFYALNKVRHGRVEKVGPKRVTVSYVTEREKHDAKRAGRTPYRFSRTLPLATLARLEGAYAWRTTDYAVEAK